MHNFDLTIEGDADNYTVRARIEGAEAVQSFTFPFTNDKLEILLLRMGTGQQGVWRRPGDSPELQAAKEFGSGLFTALFTGQVRDLLRRAQNQYPVLRIRLSFNRAPALANLPWEFLYDADDNTFLALSKDSPIVRYLEQAQRVLPLNDTKPFRLLVVIAAPVDLPHLDADREWNQLQAALAPLVARGLLQIERLTPPTFATLQAALRTTQYHLVHFIGHGGFSTEVQDGVLYFEDERRHSRRITGQSLGILLRDQRATLRFVFLNVCEGGKTAVNDPFAGVAQSLIQQGIPAVLAMQSKVRDEHALIFAKEFYATFTSGFAWEMALTEARKALFAETQGVEWGIPVLYSRVQEGQSINLSPTALESSSFSKERVSDVIPSKAEVWESPAPFISENLSQDESTKPLVSLSELNNVFIDDNPERIVPTYIIEEEYIPLMPVVTPSSLTPKPKQIKWYFKPSWYISTLMWAIMGWALALIIYSSFVDLYKFIGVDEILMPFSQDVFIFLFVVLNIFYSIEAVIRDMSRDSGFVEFGDQFAYWFFGVLALSSMSLNKKLKIMLLFINFPFNILIPWVLCGVFTSFLPSSEVNRIVCNLLFVLYVFLSIYISHFVFSYYDNESNDLW